MPRVKFYKGTSTKMLELAEAGQIVIGALYVNTDNGHMWLGTSESELLQINCQDEDEYDFITDNGLVEYIVKGALTDTSTIFTTDDPQFISDNTIITTVAV